MSWAIMGLGMWYQANVLIDLSFQVWSIKAKTLVLTTFRLATESHYIPELRMRGRSTGGGVYEWRHVGIDFCFRS